MGARSSGRESILSIVAAVSLLVCVYLSLSLFKNIERNKHFFFLILLPGLSTGHEEKDRKRKIENTLPVCVLVGGGIEDTEKEEEKEEEKVEEDHGREQKQSERGPVAFFLGFVNKERMIGLISSI